MRALVSTAALVLLVFFANKAQAEDSLATQLRCLRDAIYTEARGEPRDAQLMVAYVVYNHARGDRSKFCEAVYEQRRNRNGELVSQFSGPVHHPVELADGDPRLLEASEVAAHVGLGHFVPSGKLKCAKYYENAATADPRRSQWFKTLRYAGVVGRQTFFCPPLITAHR